MEFLQTIYRLLALYISTVTCNPSAKSLYNDIIQSKTYNKLIRPVRNNSDILLVKMGMRLSQLIDVDERNQIMTTNIWLQQVWYDYNLVWNPDEYGGVDQLYVPASEIWLPDIVMFNNADGVYEVTLMTKATVHNNGKVVWEPPAIYKSYCQINVEFFPFDEQECSMKFGSWTYGGHQVDLRHLDQKKGSKIIPVSIDLSSFYRSVEWDILSVPAERHPPKTDPYPIIQFDIKIRRKTLFYTMNLIIPCVAISFLTVLVFYLPSDSGEKITLCISILLSLTVFFLLLAEIIPPTSLVVPLVGKYLMFTMILVTMSIVVTVIVLNVHFRSPTTHTMAPWVRHIFLGILPKLLFMKRPHVDSERPCQKPVPETFVNDCSELFYKSKDVDKEGVSFNETMRDVIYIATALRSEDETTNVKEDWKYVAMVVDRLFLSIFTIACFVGTSGIILQAPTLYDRAQPIVC